MKEECKTCAKDKCPMHPNYKAKYKPRCNCEVCWDIWKQKEKKKEHEALKEEYEAQIQEDLDSYNTPEYH